MKKLRSLICLMLSLAVGTPLLAQADVLLLAGERTADVVGTYRGLERDARIDIEGVSIADALTELRNVTGVPLTFSPSLETMSAVVSCDCSDVSVETALDIILAGTTLSWGLVGQQVLIEPAERDGSSFTSGAAGSGGQGERGYIATFASAGETITPTRRLTGTIRGQVTNAQTAAPLPGVQVYVEGLQIGWITDAQGNYQLQNVPAGPITIVAQSIGYATERAQIVVAAGEVSDHDFRLTESALALDEIVVTGTAGGTQRRAIGNVVSSVNADEILTNAPVATVDQLLGQRTPGLMLMPGTGQVGTGAAVRIRGVGSLTQGNDPIVYIDGIRIDSDSRGGPSQRGGSNVSRLNDIHPSDIESIEIIKGPAAATLYGTEASNGVIQIITKRGATGAPQFDATVRMGTNWLWNPEGRAGLRWMPNPSDPANPISFNAYRHEIENGNGPIYGYGALRSYNLSLRGGNEALRYFTSVSLDDDTGVVEWNWDQRFAARANLDVTVTDEVSIAVGTAFITGQTRLAQTSIETDPFTNLVWANPRNLEDGRRGFRGAPPEDWGKVESRADNDRSTTSVELRYRPTGWMTHRLIGGLDVNNFENFTLFPMLPEGASHFFGQNALGNKSVARGKRQFVTVDYSGSANFDVEDFSFQPSVGLQFYRSETGVISASGQSFPALPITTISGGSIRNSGETFVQDAQLGVYFQQQVGWNNRAFLTGAVRADSHSAFGAEFDAAIYPKLSATWVISEEPFWRWDQIGQLRFRAAWGAAGQQPETFAAARLYAPFIGYRDQPALSPDAFGNAELKPERGEELEIGFDASLWNDRLTLEFTRYDKSIKDAIINRELNPSSGFTGSQIVNLGLLRAWGNEIGMSARLMERGNFSWEVDAQYATMDNEIRDVGDQGVIFGGTGSQHREGYSVADIYFLRVLDAEIDAQGTVLSALCDGGTGPQGVDPGGAPVPCSEAPQVRYGASQPTWQLGVGSSVNFGPVRLYARVEGNGGHKQVNTEIRPMHNGATTEGAVRGDNPILQAYRLHEVNRTGLYEAGFLRLREVSASVDVPPSLAGQIRAQRASVSLGLRNLAMLWTAEHGWSTPRDGHVREEIADMIIWDPEVRSTGQLSTGYQTIMPPTASATLTFRVGF